MYIYIYIYIYTYIYIRTYIYIFKSKHLRFVAVLRYMGVTVGLDQAWAGGGVGWGGGHVWARLLSGVLFEC
jgi:hypothetical protein